MERRHAEPGFVDSMTGQLGGPRTSQLLTRLDALIPWEELARPIRKLYRHGSQGGRRPWPAGVGPGGAMLKCLFPAKWFGLSGAPHPATGKSVARSFIVYRKAMSKPSPIRGFIAR